MKAELDLLDTVELMVNVVHQEAQDVLENLDQMEKLVRLNVFNF